MTYIIHVSEEANHSLQYTLHSSILRIHIGFMPFLFVCICFKVYELVRSEPYSDSYTIYITLHYCIIGVTEQQISGYSHTNMTYVSCLKNHKRKAKLNR